MATFSGSLDTIVLIYAIVAVATLASLLPAKGQNRAMLVLIAVFWPMALIMWINKLTRFHEPPIRTKRADG